MTGFTARKPSGRNAVISLLHFQCTLQIWVPKDKVGKRPIELCYFYVFARVFHFPETSWVCVSRAFLCFSVYMFIMQLHCVQGALISACSLSMSKRWHTHDIVSCFCPSLLFYVSLFLCSLSLIALCLSFVLVLVPCLLSSLLLLSAYWHRFDKQHTLHLFPPPTPTPSPPPHNLSSFCRDMCRHTHFMDLLAFPFPLHGAWHIFCLPCYLLVCLSITACVCVCVCEGYFNSFPRTNSLHKQSGKCLFTMKLILFRIVEILYFSFNIYRATPGASFADLEVCVNDVADVGKYVGRLCSLFPFPTLSQQHLIKFI